VNVAARWLLVVAVAAALAVAWAGSYPEDGQRAIDIVAAHPAFAGGLADVPGWTATAYDALDRYGLWRVDLAAADGRALGWAQVQLATGRVTAWETDFPLEGAAYEAAQERLLAFLRQDEGFRALGGDPDDHEWTWIGYEAWRDTWVVYLERGPDSLQVLLRSPQPWTRSLEGLHVVQINAAYLPAYETWRDQRGSAAVARLFFEPGVAEAVRGVEGWTAEVEPVGRDVWRVQLKNGARVLLDAVVDLGRATVIVRR
jgi:hypothetical protein